MSTLTRMSAFAALLLVFSCPAALAQSSSPTCTDRVTGTPDFYQKNGAAELPDHGRRYCCPVAVSDAIMYLAAHGYPNLLPPNTPLDTRTQIDLIHTLASDRYMDTDMHFGTSGTGFISGVYKYVTDCGYRCRIEYKGTADLKPEVAAAKIGDKPDLAWIKRSLDKPNASVWLSIKRLVRDDSPSRWKYVGEHTVLVVGYAASGNSPAAPNVLILHNSSVQCCTPHDDLDSQLSDNSITLTLIGTAKAGQQDDLPTEIASGYFSISGPGVPKASADDVDVIDGVAVMTIGKNGR